VKIIKKDDTISPADKLKQLHYDNKYLYGKKAKIGKQNKTREKPQVSDDVPNDLPKKNDLSTEIYWMTQHIPVLDFTKPSKKKAKKIKDVADANTKTRAPKKVKKKIDQPQVQIPETLERLEDLPKPVKINIKNSLDQSFQSKTETLFKSPVQNSEQQDIPFESSQLKSIVNFPLTWGIKPSKLINNFKPYSNETGVKHYSIPSVTKVLQSTIPYSEKVAKRILVNSPLYFSRISY
jgi:hypothetical protein